MFINKSNAKLGASYQAMSNSVCTFLKTEITCIPGILKKYIGEYYNNALCNGATWVFAIWCILHYLFDKLIDAFLKKLKYKQYVRERLKNSLWYLGFYGTALVYCSATLTQNEIELFNFKRMSVPSGASLPFPIILGYTLISTFYLHSAVWEGLAGHRSDMMSYLFLSVLCLFSYIVRITESAFTLTALLSIGYVLVEATRIIFLLSSRETYTSKLFVAAVFTVTLALFVSLHVVVIPLTFVVPLTLKILSDYPSISVIVMYLSLLFWAIFNFHKSIFYKFVDHWLYHEETKNDFEDISCSGGILECSLFPARTDESFYMYISREEIKKREARMMSLRKPKNKNMLLQTLKCMVAIKRKLSEKRLSESSDSDDDSDEKPFSNENDDLVDADRCTADQSDVKSDCEEDSDDEDSAKDPMEETRKEATHKSSGLSEQKSSPIRDYDPERYSGEDSESENDVQEASNLIEDSDSAKDHDGTGKLSKAAESGDDKIETNLLSTGTVQNIQSKNDSEKIKDVKDTLNETTKNHQSNTSTSSEKIE